MSAPPRPAEKKSRDTGRRLAPMARAVARAARQAPARPVRAKLVYAFPRGLALDSPTCARCDTEHVYLESRLGACRMLDLLQQWFALPHAGADAIGGARRLVGLAELAAGVPCDGAAVERRLSARITATISPQGQFAVILLPAASQAQADDWPPYAPETRGNAFAARAARAVIAELAGCDSKTRAHGVAQELSVQTALYQRAKTMLALGLAVGDTMVAEVELDAGGEHS